MGSVYAALTYTLRVVRVAGYWILYAVVGVLVVAMLLAGGGDLGSEDSKSPIRPKTKVVGAVNGIAVGVAILGLYLTRDAAANRNAAAGLLYGGSVAAVVFGVWAWIWIARDLRKRRSR